MRGTPVAAVKPTVGVRLRGDVLADVGPGQVAAGIALVLALHLLQEQDVGGEPVQAVAQLVDHHAAREVRKTLVDVVGRDREAH